MALGPSYPNSKNFPRYMGLPIRVRWEGWTSDTYELQRNGWEVSVAQSPTENIMQIALHHRHMRLTGISSMMRFNYREIMDKHQYLEHMEPIRIVHIAPQIHVVTITQAQLADPRMSRGRQINWDRFQPVDAAPSVVMEEIKSLDDLVHFRPLPEPAQEIIIPEKSVSDLLSEILQKQEPEQMKCWQRVQEEALLAKGRPQGLDLPEKKVHAQIITLRHTA